MSNQDVDSAGRSPAKVVVFLLCGRADAVRWQSIIRAGSQPLPSVCCKNTTQHNTTQHHLQATLQLTASSSAAHARISWGHVSYLCQGHITISTARPQDTAPTACSLCCHVNPNPNPNPNSNHNPNLEAPQSPKHPNHEPHPPSDPTY
ncbi:hypothetical protein PMIN04_013230 [Paraphaeosphaeria minitans]